MTPPDDLTHSYKRREVLRLAGLAVGAAVVPSACRSVGTSSGEANATVVQFATPNSEPRSIAQAQPQAVSKVVLVRSESRIAGTRKAIDLLQPQGIQDSSPHQRLMIAEINQTYQPALVLVDGVEALVNGGPEAGKLVKSGVILAGTDRVAVDVVAIGILRSLGTTEAVSSGSIWDLEQIRAVQLGLGASSPEQIELVAADGASQRMADQIRKLIVA